MSNPTQQTPTTAAGACDKPGSVQPAGSALGWQCDLGNGQWDHDWVEKHDAAGGEGGGPMIEWSWRECRVCGITEEESQNNQLTDAGTKDHE